MKRTLLALALAVVPAFSEEIDVVATVPTLASVAREVGGDRVRVVALCKPEEDAHFVDAKPSFMVALRKADLFLVVGLELEVGWVPPLLEGCRNGKIQPGTDGYFEAGAYVRAIEVPTGPVDRSMGDVHPVGNPHFSVDPLSLRAVATALADRMAKIAPAGAAAFQANLKAYHRKLDEALFGADLVDEVGGAKLARLLENGEIETFLREGKLESRLGGWLGKLAPFRGKEVVAYHKSLNYLFARFGIEVAGYVEEKPGIPPSSGQVGRVISLIRDRNIKVVFTHPFYPPAATDRIASETAAKIRVVPLEHENAMVLIDRIVGELAESLR